jgi:hypothetical protein
MKWFNRRAAARLGVLAVAGVAMLSIFGVSAAFAAGTRAGDATVTTAGGTPLASGAQGTAFSLKLPAGAACAGSTAINGNHIWGFVIPASGDPTLMTFDPTNGPSSPALPLFDTTGTQYGPANTAVSPPGLITNIPTFDWNKFLPTDLPAGNYRVGIACSNGDGPPATENNFWDVPVTFDGSLNWQATNPTSSVPESPLNIALPLSAAVLLGGGVIVVMRRRSKAGEVAA